MRGAFRLCRMHLAPSPFPRGNRAPMVSPLVALARASLALPAEALRAECVETFLTVSGPGGQHRNKVESGVRLHHRPTGVVVTATERRSQARNRDEALERLREELSKLSYVPPVRRETRPSRGQKRRRLEDKRRQSEKKQQRRGAW